MALRRWHALVALSLGVGCSAANIDYLWLRCSEERPCAGGYECLGNLCEPYVAPTDGGPGNVLRNPGFEELLADGGARAWKFYTNTTVTPVAEARSGTTAGSVSRSEDAGLASVVSSVHQVALGSRWCASAWVRSELAPRAMYLAVYEVELDGGAANTGIKNNSTDGSTMSSATQWSLLKTRNPVAMTGTRPALQVRFWPGDRNDNPVPYLIDDATLVEVPGDAGCP